MARCEGWRWRHPAIAAALAFAPLIGAAARAAAPEEGARAKQGAAAARREAMEIYRAFREIQEALQKEGRATDARDAKPPARPAKSTQAPTLRPSDVDALLARGYAAAETPTARPTSDEEFVRRVYLDVAGKLPTPEQVKAFVGDRDEDKRARLIDRLLEGPDHASNWARYWRDVIRFHATNTNPIQTRYDVLEAWLAERFAANAPWDEIATALITATGRNDEVGPVNFTMAHMGQPVEMAGEVSRIFLGVQIQCAQCHDHPSDPWKREQFHEFAAFFAGTRSRRIDAPGQGVARRAFEVVSRGRPRYAMPDLKDPQKQIPVEPRFFLAGPAESIPGDLTVDQRRALAASYVTAQDNPWFARAFVNRVWAALMGQGFANPVDDLGPTREVDAPEVLEALASQWQRGGYDIRWLFRTILNTEAYRRQARAVDPSEGRAPFAANCPSRLRSDQILDALTQALGLSMGEEVRGRGPAQGGAMAFRAGPRQLMSFLFGVDPSTPSDEVLGTIPQALFLMNGPQINRAIRAGDDSVLGAILSATTDDREATEALYLRVLARRPNADEVATCLRHLRKVGDRAEAFEDILWSLINTTEFVSRR